MVEGQSRKKPWGPSLERGRSGPGGSPGVCARSQQLPPTLETPPVKYVSEKFALRAVLDPVIERMYAPVMESCTKTGRIIFWKKKGY